MRFLDRDLPDAILLLPLFGGLALAGYFAYRLTGRVRSSFVFIGLYALFGVLGILIYSRYQPLREEGSRPSEVSPLIRRLLTICFFGTLSGAILALEFLSPGAIRPPAFFGFIALGIGLLTARVFLGTDDRRDVLWIIGMVVLLGAVARLAMVYLNPYPYVSDTQFHWYVVQNTVVSAEFVGRGPYKSLPIFYLFNVNFFLLANPSTELEGLFPLLNSLVIIGTIPVIYLLGRWLGSVRAGLFAALALLFFGRYFPSIQYKTNWFGIVFLLLAFLVVLYKISTRTNRFEYSTLFWLFAIGLLLIHPVNFIVLLILLFGSSLAYHISNLNRDRVWSLRDWYTPVPVFSVGLVFLAYLIYTNHRVFASLVISVIGIDTSATQQLGLTTNMAGVPVVSDFTLELLLNFLGLAAPVTVIVIGLLSSVEEREFSPNAIALGLGVLYAFVFVVLMSGRGGELSITRLLLYIAPIGAIVAGVGLSRVGARLPLRKGASLLLIVVVLTSFLAMSSYINSTGIATDAVQTEPSAVKASTLSSHQFLTHVPSGANLTSTSTTAQYVASTNPIRGMYQLENADAVRRFYQQGWHTSDYYLVNEATLSKYHSQTGPEFRVLASKFESDHSRIYANEQFTIYYRHD